MQVRYIIGPEGNVDPADRGLAYGDGLFETIALRAGTLQRLGSHFARLRLGCERLRIPLPDLAELETRCRAAAAGIDRGQLKLILTRGSGPRGYAPPPAPIPTVILSASASSARAQTEITLAQLQQRLGINETLAGIKHLCRLEQVLGRLELESLDADEGLMLCTNGTVVGGTSRNLFAVFGQTLVTPDLSCAGICGVMRRAVLEHCQTLSIPVSQVDLAPEELLHADEVFMTNALVGIQSVSRLDKHAFALRAMASRLRTALDLDDHA